MKLILGMLMLCGLHVSSCLGTLTEDNLKMEYIRYATKYMRPCEWENQSYWSTNWSVAAVFFDLNRDGRFDALVATPDQQTDRSFVWLAVKKNENGDMFIMDDLKSNIYVSCYPFAIYRVTLSGGVSLLVGRDCFVEKYESGKRVWKEKCIDLIFRTDASGRLAPLLDLYMLDKVVGNPDFLRLERVDPEWYLGYDLKRLPPDKEHAISAKGNLPNGGLVAPADFNSFVRQYRNDVKRRLGLKRPVTVYAVFFDVDFDGDADCYVSSDAEAVGNGKYRWTLHLNDANVFRRAKERVWRNRGTIHDVAMLEPEEVAPKAAFYYVVRTFGSPQILVMESDGKRLHTHAYTHLLSEEDRRNCPPQDRYLLKKGQPNFSEWEGDMQGKYGFNPPKDFRDQVSWLFFHHLERLPCAEFPDND